MPSLTETVITQWIGWAIPPAAAKAFVDPGLLQSTDVVAQFPANPVPVDPGDPVYSLGAVRETLDWATHPSAAISYGNVLIGKTGGIATAPAALATRTINLGDVRLNAAVTAAAAVPPGITVIGREGLGLRQVQSIQTALRPQAVVQSANVTR